MQTTVSETELAPRLRLAITRSARRLRQEVGGALSPSQGAALATIARHGPLPPSELATRERIQRPTATRVLARLEEAGLGTRAAHPADRRPRPLPPADPRSSLVTTTEQGHATLEQIRERKDTYLAARLDGLSPDDLATLDRAASILERVLDE